MPITPASDAPRVTLDISAATILSGSDLRVDTAPGTTRAYTPSVTALADGGWVVTWVDERAGNGDIYQRRYAADGSPSGEMRVDAAPGSTGVSWPSVTALADGGWVVTWTDTRASNGDIYQRRYAADGSPSGEVRVDAGPEWTAAIVSSVTALADGGWVVTWRDTRAGNGDIYQRRYAADGTPSGEMRVDGGPGTTWADEPSVTALADGGWVVTWYDERASNYDIYQRRYAADGSPSGEMRVDAAPGATAAYVPSVTALADGGWVVTWYDYRAGNLDIYQRRYAVDGSPGEEMRVDAAPGVTAAYEPSVTALADGGWVVTWRDERDGTGDIYQRRYAADGSAGGEMRVDAWASYAGQPSVTALADGGWVVTWTDYRDGNGDIYQRRFSPRLDGTEDAPLTVPVNIQLADPSETITSLQVAGVPAGWTLAGPDGSTATFADGIWTITGGTLSGNVSLTLTPAADANGAVTLQVTAFSAQEGFSSAASRPLTVSALFAAANDAPTLVNAIADQSSAEDAPWSFQVPANAFGDLDGDTLSFMATLADGSGLPGWLTFDAATRTFSGTPPANFNGQIGLRITASDGTATASDEFVLTITPVNDGPAVLNAIADQSSAEDAPWSFQVPANAFGDLDGDTLSFTATLADGSDLPAWLTFDAATRTFSGTPPANYNGQIGLRVTASDGTATASDEFVLDITPVNDGLLLENVAATNDAGESVSGAITADNRPRISGTTEAFATVTIRNGLDVLGTTTAAADGSFSIELSALSDGVWQLSVSAVNATGDESEATLLNLRVDTDGTLNGTGSNDRLLGGAGEDVLIGGAGNDVLSGGSGTDTADYGGALRGVVVGLYNNTAGDDGFGTTDTLSGIENLRGSSFSDVLAGDGGRNELAGLDGNDSLYGGYGDDILSGGAGDDWLHGSQGNDALAGGSGTDTADYGGALRGVVVGLYNGTASEDGFGTTDTLSGIENLRGSSFSDVLMGDAGSNELEGLDGNDFLYGGYGDDILSGGAGDDWLHGSQGNDTLVGGSGTDTADYGGALGGVVVALYNGTASEDGFGTTDTLSGIENITGSSFSDVLAGDQHANVLVGGGGSDALYGGYGDDYLVGGAGADYLVGSEGLDNFVFSASDFEAGVYDWVDDLGESATDYDFITLLGVSADEIVMVEYQGGVFISTAGLNFSGGIFVNDRTIAQVQDQMLFA